MTTAWGAAGLDEIYWEKHSLDIRIRLAGAPYLDGSWGYDLGEPAVLWDLPSAMRASKIVGRSKRTNCSTMTTSVLTSCFPSAAWGSEEYGDLQVYADRLPATDSPIKAVERVGVGRRVDAFVSERWHLVQGVRRGAGHAKGFSGHAFLVLAEDELQVLEATSLRGDDGERIGPRYRTATLAELVQQYPVALHLAVLG